MRIALVGAELEENLAIRYIWAALQQAGHEVVQVVFNSAGDLDRAAHEIADSGTQVAGFSMVFTSRASEFAALAARSRELGYRGHVIAGGHFAAFNADALLRDEPAFDSVAIGEGEEIMCALAENLQNLAVVRGLVWRSTVLRDKTEERHGTDSAYVVRNSAAVKPPCLDELASPVRKRPPHGYLGLPIANVLGSRGCTHACSFCSIAAWHQLCRGERFRVRTPENIAAELADLYGSGYRIFNFHDDNFFLHDTSTMLKRVRELDHELRRRGVGRIAFAVKARPDNIERELLAFLKEMGLFRVFLGIEAGTADALKNLGRRQTLAQNERALEIINGLELHCCFNLLLLNPDSTLQDLCANVKFLRTHPLNPMNFCRTEVYSGTPLERKLRAEGRLLDSYWGYDYQIRDKQAQTAFELIHAALFERHHVKDNVHHLTMGLDYEHQLMMHFFGGDPDLRQRVRDFIYRVNLDSCALLDQAVNAAADGFRTEVAFHKCVHDLLSRARKEESHFKRDGKDLITAVRAKAFGRPRREWSGWSHEAAAVALVATLLTGGLGTASEERVPNATEMIVKPTFEAEAASILPQFKKDVLPKLALQLEKPVALKVTLILDLDGSVQSVFASDDRGNSISGDDLQLVKFKDASIGRRRIFRFNVTEAEVLEAREHVFDPPEGPVPPEADSKNKAEFKKYVMRVLAPHLLPAVVVELELWFGRGGEVRYVGIFRPDARTTKELSDEDRKNTARWLQELENNDFAVREQASASLLKLGIEVTPLVKTMLEKTKDPELKSRYLALLTALNPAITGPGVAQAVADLRRLRDARLANCRVVLKISLMRYHMYEMAPTPGNRRR